jgi:hypothetical protein
MEAKLISAKQLAVRYSVSAKTVRKWARTSLLPVVRLNCRCIRFDIEKCDSIIDRRTRGGSVRIGLLVAYTAILLPLLSLTNGNIQATILPLEGSHRIAKPLYGLKTVPRVRIPPAPLLLKKLLARLLSWFARLDGLTGEVAC